MDMSLSKLRDSDGQGSPVCCIRGVKNSQTQLNNNSNINEKLNDDLKRKQADSIPASCLTFQGWYFIPGA